jgi:hypothetical protein
MVCPVVVVVGWMCDRMIACLPALDVELALDRIRSPMAAAQLAGADW